MTTTDADRARTGTVGLDEILSGGLPRDRLYLLYGEPGTGKTTVGMQFLREGVRNGVPCLYITLSETAEKLAVAARSHGWSLDGIEIFELHASQDDAEAGEEYVLFHPSEVELSETTRKFFDVVERVKPRRLVFDSLSEMRLMAQEPLRFRRQILAMKEYFVGKGCTVLLLDDNEGRAVSRDDRDVQSLAHGVLVLDKTTPKFGPARRRISIAKLRGLRYRDGYHDCVLTTGGLLVFPQLTTNKPSPPFRPGTVSSAVGAVDRLLGGGLERGSSALFLGPVGVGKSALANQYALAAAHRSEKVTIYTFEETAAVLFARADSLGMDLRRACEEGRVCVEQVDPAELPPGQFACKVQRSVADGASMIVIDSLNGYFNAMPDEHVLALHMHNLITYLSQRGVVTLLTMSQHGFLGSAMVTPVDVSYLVDVVVLLRYFEAEGEVRKAISVVKKRNGRHEAAIRELRMGDDGIRVGEPLRGFRGVLTGTPALVAGDDKLMSGGPRDDAR